MAGLLIGVMLLGAVAAHDGAGSAAGTPAESKARTVPQDTAAARAIEIRRAPGPIRIDGHLDDPGWEGAATATGFIEFQPREGAEPPVRTEVWLTYDERYLYLAFLAHDDPRRIRAGYRERNQIWDDDVVGILLDTHGDANTAVLLVSNPYGIQGDLLFMAGGGEDPSFDVVFESAGRITEQGYQVEMAIPFRSLRFPDRADQRWRVNLYRAVPRSSRHQMTWFPLDLDNPCIVCQTAPLLGLEGVRPGGGLELLPAVVASQASTLADPGDPARGLERGPLRAEPSLGAQYLLPNGWVLEGAYNPDFSQVESDAAQIDVNTTFALFFPERRPFFQEGAELFDTWINVAYTRAINAPRFAGKLTGRAGQTSVAYLAARDDHTPFVVPFRERTAVLQAGRSTSNLVRVRHNLGESAWAGLLVTDRRLDGGGSGTNVSGDVRLRFGGNYYLDAQVSGSYTVEPDEPDLGAGLGDATFGSGSGEYTAAFDGERFAGLATMFRFSRRARVWNFELQYNDASPTYRADLGFQTRNDFRRLSAGSHVTFYFGDGWIERLTPRLSGDMRRGYEGGWMERFLRPGVGLTLRHQTYVSLGATLGRERFRDTELLEIRRLSLFVNSDFSEPVNAGFSLGHGRTVARRLDPPVVGTGTDASAWVVVRPSPRLRIRPSFNYSRLLHPDTGEAVHDGYILRNRVDYQFNRELGLRFVTQYDDFSGTLSLEPLLTYRLNPFSIFYIGSTHGYRDFDDPIGFEPTRRQFFAKLQYLFQV